MLRTDLLQKLAIKLYLLQKLFDMWLLRKPRGTVCFFSQYAIKIPTRGGVSDRQLSKDCIKSQI